MYEFNFFDLYEFDKKLTKRLYAKDPDKYECAYLYLFGGSAYNPYHFLKTLEMRLK